MTKSWEVVESMGPYCIILEMIHGYEPGWRWRVKDGREIYDTFKEGVAPDEASAKRAAVDALAAHLEEMMTAIRAWRGEEV